MISRPAEALAINSRERKEMVHFWQPASKTEKRGPRELPPRPASAVAVARVNWFFGEATVNQPSRRGKGPQGGQTVFGEPGGDKEGGRI